MPTSNRSPATPGLEPAPQTGAESGSEIRPGQRQVHGFRLSTTQARLYRVLQDAAGPMTAYQLLDELNAEPVAGAAKRVYPQTVYRSLAQLQGRGLVHRVESANAYLSCRAPTQPHRGIHLLCDRCGHATELIDTKVSRSLDADAAQHQFSIDRQVVELHGLCADCTHADARN